MPVAPAAVAITATTRSFRAMTTGSALAGWRAIRPNASVSSPSPARIAIPSPATTCSVGRPRRIVSLSIAGRSS
jgi:hypothetical protein